MHIHILGICGTFMGGVAALARAAGHDVTGSDANVYPPMSTQLQALGIDIHQGWDSAPLDQRPDVVVVGNVMSRGNPIVEEMLDRGMTYASGPEWLAKHVLRERRVIAVAGTHGKTTTSSIVAWLLEATGRKPGFLIGGVPRNFGVTARFGDSEYFVVEADEYDTAFFDKRAKFVHYRPEVAVINNLEFDHADIYRDMEAIRFQFHQLVRGVPRRGRIVINARSAELQRVLEMGVWTPVQTFATSDGEADLCLTEIEGDSQLLATMGDKSFRSRGWSMPGEHNRENAAAAVLAVAALGVPVQDALDALSDFAGVGRRLELLADVGGIRIYDDFAHHPTAIERTIATLRHQLADGRLIVALEPRTNTMRLGVHAATLAPALAGADEVFVHAPPTLGWSVDEALAPLGDRCRICASYDALAAELTASVRGGDVVVLMSNGGFGTLRQQLPSLIESRA